MVSGLLRDSFNVRKIYITYIITDKLTYGLMLLWFTDLMSVTEEVTIHRPNVSTLLSSLNSHNVKVAQKPFQTLGHIFAKPKDPDDGGLLPDGYLHLVRKKAAN